MAEDHAGHRRRLRERFARAGLDGFAEHEIAELLLTYAIPRRDCKETARTLLKRFGGLRQVLGAPPAELATVPGVGPAAAALLALAGAVGPWCLRRRARGRPFARAPAEVVEYLRAALGGLREEVFLVLLLNARNEVLADELVQRGTVDQAAVYPRQVCEAALRHRASAIVLVHNHPGGQLVPSALDRQVTREVARAAASLQLRLHDHLIVTGDGWFSFAAQGLL